MKLFIHRQNNELSFPALFCCINFKTKKYDGYVTVTVWFVVVLSIRPAVINDLAKRKKKSIHDSFTFFHVGDWWLETQKCFFDIQFTSTHAAFFSFWHFPFQLVFETFWNDSSITHDLFASLTNIRFGPLNLQWLGRGRLPYY